MFLKRTLVEWFEEMHLFSHKLMLRLISLAALVMVLALLPAGALAESAGSGTESFYGYVFNNDDSVCSGYVVTAMIGATKVAQTVTDCEGRYGYSPEFVVTGNPGATLQFSINDHPAIQRATFQGGIATKLDLTAYGAASCMPQTSCGSGSCCGGGSCGAPACIASGPAPAAMVGVPYSLPLYARGGIMPYAWSIMSGSLPQGLTLDSTLGVVKGVPTVAQACSFTVKVDDSSSHYQTATISILVKGEAGQTAPTPLQTASPVITGISSNFLGKVDTLNVNGSVLNAATEIASGDRRVRLSMGAGTLLKLQGQSVIGAGNESNPPPANDGSVAVRAYSFTPPGATFSPSVTMSLRYEIPLPPGVAESGLYIAFWNGSAWQKLDSMVNTASKEVSATVSHFTIFAIRGMPETAAQPSPGLPAANNNAPSAPAPAITPPVGATAAGFTFSDLEITPEAVITGEPVDVTVRVVNSGALQATGNIILKINGHDEIQKTVAVEKGSSQTVSFEVPAGPPGSYTVGVGGLSADFLVTSHPVARGLPGVVVGIIVAGGLLAMIIVVIGLFKRRTRRDY
jgi:hypothetical protein